VSAAATGCSSGGQAAELPTETVVVTATAPSESTEGITQSATPTVAPSQEPEPTHQAVPLSATLSIATVEPDGSVTLGGFVSSVSEDGGTCLFTLTGAGGKLTKSSEGLENVGTTGCGTVSFASADVSRGTWTAVLTYDSRSTRATSNAMDVQVP
jgi:hypothetical protein